MHLRRRRLRRARAAFTLVEVSISAVVLAIAVSGVVGALVAATTLERVNRETALAQQAGRRVIEELQGIPFEEVFATYNDWNGDDGGLTFGVRAANFAVAGLDPQPGDADGLCGEVRFPVVLAGGVPQLREDVVDDGLGMPRDLAGGDGVDANDHSLGYELLPVRVRIAWRGVSGDRQLDFVTILCER